MTTLQEALGQMAEDPGMKMTAPALKGVMGGTTYFVITLPFSVAVRYLTVTDRNLPPKERENRVPSANRFAEIAQYIRNNPDDYRFGALTCTYGRDGVNKPIEWMPASPEGEASFIGMLTLDQRDPLIIVDGQHRFGAIRKVVEEQPELADERITIVLFPYTNVEHGQQLFSDLNRTAKKTTKSLDILFNHRDAVNKVVQALVESSQLLRDRVDLENSAVPAGSQAILTLAAVYQASSPIISVAHSAGLVQDNLNSKTDIPSLRDEYVQLLLQVWDTLAECFPEWKQAADGTLSVPPVRSHYLHWNSGVISGIGEFIANAMEQKGQNWHVFTEKALTHPETYDWRRDAPAWQGLITSGNQVLPRSGVRIQLKAYLKKLAGLELTKGDQTILKAIGR